MAAIARNGNGNGSWIWPVAISVFTTLINGFLFYVVNNISVETTRLEHAIEKHVDTSAKTYTTISEEAQYRSRVADEIKRIDSLIDRGTLAQMRMRDQNAKALEPFITKETYLANHKPLQDDIINLRERLNEFRKEARDRSDSLQSTIGSAVTLSDKFKEIQEQLRLLQSQVIRPQSVAPIPVQPVPDRSGGTH